MSPRSKLQNIEIREIKRQKIMKVALELFAQKGYSGTSISEIASKAKISKGLIYTYFKSKEDLLGTIINHGFDQLTANFNINKDRKLEPAQLTHFIRQLVASTQEHSGFWKLYAQISLQTEVIKKMGDRLRTMISPMIEMAKSYFEERGYSNPKMEAVLLVSLIDGIIFDYIIAPQKYPITEVSEEIIRRYC